MSLAKAIFTPQSRRAPVSASSCAGSTSCGTELVSPSPAMREKEGPSAKRWEGEGIRSDGYPPPHPALSPGRGEGIFCLCGGADRGALYLAADERLELGEIVREAAAQVARDLVIGALVGPGAARVEDGGRQVGAALGDEEPEIRVLAHCRPGEAAVERGAQE